MPLINLMNNPIYLQYINIIIGKSLISIWILITLIFLKLEMKLEITAHISLIFAVSQIFSQFDGGIPAYIMSSDITEKEIKKNDLLTLTKEYCIYTIPIIALLCVLSLYIKKIHTQDIISCAFIGYSMSIYNLETTYFIKHKNIKKMVIMTVTICLFYMVFFAISKEIDNNLLLPIFFGISLLVYPLLRKRETPTSYIDRTHTLKLQISQIASSIIINKEYMLSGVLNVSTAASLGITGRIMYIPLQITNVLISNAWSKLNKDNKLNYNKFTLTKNKIIGITFATTLLSSSIAFFLTDNLYLILILFIFNIANAYSGICSAYSSVNPESIPKLNYYLYTLIILFISSYLSYYFGLWEFSIISTIIYFIILATWIKRKIKWVK